RDRRAPGWPRDRRGCGSGRAPEAHSGKRSWSPRTNGCTGDDRPGKTWLYQGDNDIAYNFKMRINEMQPSDPPDLTLRQLQTVVALAEYGSFIATAALMKTSQPAVTRTVKHLEEVLGIKLFDRSTRSVQITAAGKEFAAVAARMLNDLKITV